jgi:fucose permease
MAHTALLGLVYLSFISIGLPDGMLGVAWPAMRLQMDQPLAAVGAITMTMTACSAASSLMAGSVVQRIGTGAVVAGSCLLTALGLLGFAVAPSFGWLVALAIPLGVGAGAVDASLNHFVSAHYSSRHMNWLHGFWGVGATTGPLVMGAALASEGGWTAGARSIGLMQLGLALVLFATVSLWSRETAQAPVEKDHPGQPSADLNPPPVAMWLAPLCFLFYVSAEMGTGLWAASILVTDRGLAAGDASVWVSLYFGAITAGRFAVGLVANRVGNRRLVRLGIVVAMAGALLFALPGVFGAFSPVGLVIMGLGCAPIFPSLMHETARRFPPEVVRTLIGRQMTCAYAGSSVVPAAFGLLATWAGLQTVMPVVVVLLLVLLLVTSRLDRLT